MEAIALGSDMKNELTAALERLLRERGFDVRLFGALSPETPDDWPSVGRSVGQAVARGDCAQGIVCCWTGTGVSIAANKVAGVRAALCGDAATAEGARTWNDANVLALSLRAVSVPLAEEILDAWLCGKPTQDPAYRAMIEDVVSRDEQRTAT
jgi:ribose 5-phosphate isomerase B